MEFHVAYPWVYEVFDYRSYPMCKCLRTHDHNTVRTWSWFSLMACHDAGEAQLAASPGPGDLPLHSWERAAAAYDRKLQEQLAAEELVETRRDMLQGLSWSKRPELTARQASALLEEELVQRDEQLERLERPEDTITSPLMRRPARKVRVIKKSGREDSLPVVPQPHMLDGLPEVTRVRRQHAAYGPPPPSRQSAGVRRSKAEDGNVDQELEESRVKRHHTGSTGPVHSFVKTDKHGHYKWGVRHHVGHGYS